MSKFDVYEAVQQKILEALDRDLMPWRRPWVARNGRGANTVSLHQNLISHRPYKGINIFLLEVTAAIEGYTSPYWLTFKQAKGKGGQVRKGEKGTLVVFWKPTAYTPKAGTKCPKCHKGSLNSSGGCDNCGQVTEKVRGLILRHYNVFNVEQVDGIEAPVIEQPEDDKEDETPEFEPLAEADRILREMPEAPIVDYGKGGAYYYPSRDSIGMPDRSAFKSSESFYSTLFHENVHATGHEKRLDRKDAFKGSFGDPDYAREELVAEMGAAMLCAVAGIDNDLDQSASYIRHWLSKADYKTAIEKDKKLAVIAAARAQKASDFILGETHENGETS